jgi:hypothetical protein
MANSADGQIKEIDYNGNIKGRVVKVDDPKMEGRIGVFIPSIIISQFALTVYIALISLALMKFHLACAYCFLQIGKFLKPS